MTIEGELIVYEQKWPPRQSLTTPQKCLFDKLARELPNQFLTENNGDLAEAFQIFPESFPMPSSIDSKKGSSHNFIRWRENKKSTWAERTGKKLKQKNKTWRRKKNKWNRKPGYDWLIVCVCVLCMRLLYAIFIFTNFRYHGAGDWIFVFPRICMLKLGSPLWCYFETRILDHEVIGHEGTVLLILVPLS